VSTEASSAEAIVDEKDSNGTRRLSEEKLEKDEFDLLKISTVEIKLKTGKSFWNKYKVKSSFAEMLAD
jgi:hypothetical protein